MLGHRTQDELGSRRGHWHYPAYLIQRFAMAGPVHTYIAVAIRVWRAWTYNSVMLDTKVQLMVAIKDVRKFSTWTTLFRSLRACLFLLFALMGTTGCASTDVGDWLAGEDARALFELDANGAERCRVQRVSRYGEVSPADYQ